MDPMNLLSRSQNEDATSAKISQSCSVVGSVGWVAHQCRPDLSYHVCRLETV